MNFEWLIIWSLTLQQNKEKRYMLNSSIRISTYLILEIALDQYLHSDSYAWQYNNDSTFLLIDKLPMHLKPPTTWLSKFRYPSLVRSFMVSQQVFWYPNGMRAISRWTNHLDSTSVILGLHMRYIIDNLINKSLRFRIILTKVTFVSASVASLMLHSTCFVLGLPLGTFILAYVLIKCHFEAFVAPSRSSVIFCRNRTIRFSKPDPLVLTDLLWCFFFWIVSYIVVFFFASKSPSLR
jgi:hypothetical protein